MDEQKAPPRRPQSAKVAGIRALAQSEEVKIETASAAARRDRAKVAGKDLVEALAAAGFDASNGVRVVGGEVAIDFGAETAERLAAWIWAHATQAG